jgi:hypothetical protein
MIRTASAGELKGDTTMGWTPTGGRALARVGLGLCVWLGLGGLLASCAGWAVRTDVDPRADLSRYRTYAWAVAPGSRGVALEKSLAGRRVREQTDRELTLRGLRLAAAGEQPGFLVRAAVLERDRLETEVEAPQPGAAPHPNREVIRYTEGTVMLDFLDARTGNVFWRGAATRELDDPFLRSTQARDAVRSLMAAYPPRAGG